MTTAARPARPPRRTTTPRTRIGLWFGRPLASFHLIVTIAVLLTVLGLVMVLSASSAESFAADESGYALFTQQLIGVALGVVAFYAALRLPVRYLRKLSFPLFLVSITMLMLVLMPIPHSPNFHLHHAGYHSFRLTLPLMFWGFIIFEGVRY